MTNNKLMQNAIARICGEINVPNLISFRRNKDMSRAIFILGSYHVSLTTPSEVFAFLDGFETALETLNREKAKALMSSTE